MIKKIFNTFMLVFFTSVILSIFHTDNTTGVYDTIIHYVAYPIQWIFFGFCLYGGFSYSMDKYIK